MPDRPYLFLVNAVLTQDGKIALPPELRNDAQLKPGDTLDMQFYKGTIVLRKRQPLTPEQCAALLERSRSQPQPGPEDNAAVEQTIREGRAQR
jgi:bifunctional DNA-binding transcriptional regulator/antitoxin component of YhaV-PrlF toxin-antitoxin module